MTKNKDKVEDGQNSSPKLIPIDLQLPTQDLFDRVNFEEQIKEIDEYQRSDRATRMKWTIQELTLPETQSMSIGYLIGPWFIQYIQAKDCYIYGFYRSAIAMSGSILESVCLTLLHEVVGYEKKYETLPLGRLIDQIEKNVNLSEQKNLWVAPH